MTVFDHFLVNETLPRFLRLSGHRTLAMLESKLVHHILANNIISQLVSARTHRGSQRHGWWQIVLNDCKLVNVDIGASVDSPISSGDDTR